jgi:hypothetical protein
MRPLLALGFANNTLGRVLHLFFTFLILLFSFFPSVNSLSVIWLSIPPINVHKKKEFVIRVD